MSFPADYGRCLSEVAKANAVTQDISYVSETTTDTDTGATWDHTESLPSRSIIIDPLELSGSDIEQLLSEPGDDFVDHVSIPDTLTSPVPCDSVQHILPPGFSPCNDDDNDSYLNSPICMVEYPSLKPKTYIHEDDQPTRPVTALQHVRIYLSDNPRADITRVNRPTTSERRCVSAPLDYQRPQSRIASSLSRRTPIAWSQTGSLKLQDAATWMDNNWKQGTKCQRMAGREPIINQQPKSYDKIVELVKKLRDKRSPKVLSNGFAESGPRLVIYGVSGGRHNGCPMSWKFNDPLRDSNLANNKDNLESACTSSNNLVGEESVLQMDTHLPGSESQHSDALASRTELKQYNAESTEKYLLKYYIDKEKLEQSVRGRHTNCHSYKRNVRSAPPMARRSLNNSTRSISDYRSNRSKSAATKPIDTNISGKIIYGSPKTKYNINSDSTNYIYPRGSEPVFIKINQPFIPTFKVTAFPSSKSRSKKANMSRIRSATYIRQEPCSGNHQLINKLSKSVGDLTLCGRGMNYQHR